MVASSPEERRELAGALEARGHAVVTREDGGSGWDSFAHRPADVVVLDWGLAGRAAPRLVRQVRAHADGRRAFVLALCRQGADSAGSEEVLELGADDVVPWPIEPDLLQARLAVAERRVAVRQAETRARADLREAQLELARRLEGGAEEAGRPIGLLEEQVAERRRAESLSARLVAALESAGEGVVITDPQGRIEFVNRTWERMTGYSREEVIGRNPRVLKSGEHDADFYRELWQTISVGDVWHREFTNRRRDGTRFDVEQTISPVRDGSGRTIAFVGIQKDISERRRAESLLRRAHEEALEASRMKSAFLTTISHELRTPLTAILGYAHLLRDSIAEATPGEAASDVARIEEAGQRLLSRIDDLLDISRLEAGALHLDPSPTEVGPVLAAAAGAARIVAEQHRNRFLAVVPSDLGRSVVDPRRLRQVLDAVLENAATFTSEGEVSVEGHRNGREIAVSVKDTGPGMDAPQLARLFAPFSQADGSTSRRHGGLGLSMAIARRLSEMMGLTLSVESAVGAGTLFTLRLPLAPD